MVDFFWYFIWKSMKIGITEDAMENAVEIHIKHNENKGNSNYFLFPKWRNALVTLCIQPTVFYLLTWNRLMETEMWPLWKNTRQLGYVVLFPLQVLTTAIVPVVNDHHINKIVILKFNHPPCSLLRSCQKHTTKKYKRIQKY